ncbi:MAG: hypothetical protein IKN14_07735 [Clostridiales bacterium]|nr:hypothetical protein [Clostridiales bacterium]
MANCESCCFYCWDDEAEGYFCDVNFDEDEFARMEMKGNKDCPYYRLNDEYGTVRHQM